MTLFAEPSYTTSAPPEKTPLLHAHSTDYVEITYKMASFWTVMCIQPHQV